MSSGATEDLLVEDFSVCNDEPLFARFEEVLAGVGSSHRHEKEGFIHWNVRDRDALEASTASGVNLGVVLGDLTDEDWHELEEV